MNVNSRYEVSQSGVASGDLQQQTLKNLEQAEDRVRHLQRLVTEDAPCCEILRESAAAQAVMVQFERALLLHELEECLFQLRDCESGAATVLLDELLEIFKVSAT
jgi:DNA-binding FrmR family transcriptional regulator